MARFVLKNNFFEFNDTVYQQTSSTAIGTKFAPPYACLSMDRVETDLLNGEEVKPWVWMRYIDDIFFIWTEGEESLKRFLEKLNVFHPNLCFTWEFSRESINFLDVQVSIDGNGFKTDLYIKLTDCHQFLHFESSHPTHVKNLLCIVKRLEINGCVPQCLICRVTWCTCGGSLLKEDILLILFTSSWQASHTIKWENRKKKLMIVLVFPSW